MKRFATIFLFVSLVVGGASCGKKEDAPAEPAAEAPKPAPEPAKPIEPAKPATTVTKTFNELKLSMDVPADAEMTSAAANDFVQVDGDNFVVMVSVASPAASETFAEDKEEAEKDEACTFTSWVKAEEAPDGWLLHYRCKGPDDVEGHKVDIRKKIGQTSYECGWDFFKTAAEAEAVINACQSLKPAG